ncbi:BTB and MATH domain-containing protein 38-like [Mercenaria mercenaria]|uniref:BTB and MATH domain-containing protein 38-like n=1 Tax=Mercenaria mercenaria TaxID=6596 RepID=UPI00234FA36F|nr:BTB and MATH domain-containing protein 38-like [Mercenaria mercenaria]
MEVNNEFGGETGQSDLTLVVENHKILVSKSVLCIASPVFRAMLEGDYQEKTMSEIPLPGKIYEDFVEFLKCIYPDKLKKVTETNSYQLIPLAHEYQVKKIEKRCEKVFIQTVRKKHTIDVTELYRHIQLSETFALEDSKEVCIYLASENKLAQFLTAQEKYKISDASHNMIIKLALRRRELDSEDDKHLSLNTDRQAASVSSGFSFGTYPTEIACVFSAPTDYHSYTDDKVKFTLTGYIRENNSEAKGILRALRLSVRYTITERNIRSKLIQKLRDIKPEADAAEDFREEYSLLPEAIKLAVQNN